MSAAANDTTKSDEHGIAAGYYVCGVTREATLECLCGATFGGHTWAEAGDAFDEHLEEHEEPVKTSAERREPDPAA